MTDLVSYGALVLGWASGRPLYPVGSYALSGELYPQRSMMVEALDELRALLASVQGWRSLPDTDPMMQLGLELEEEELTALISQTEELLALYPRSDA